MLKLKYHHVGIPTCNQLPEAGYIEEHKFYASGFMESSYGIEWMNFEPGCKLPEIVQKIPHVAFIVNDLQEAIRGKEVIIEPNSPTEGMSVAFIVENGAPVEFIQFDNEEAEIWSPNAKYR